MKHQVLGALVVVGLLGMTSAVQAQDVEALTDVTKTYFQGEQDAGYGFLAVGALSLGAGGLFAISDDEALKGASIPVLSLGGVSTIAGVVLLFFTQPRLDERLGKIEADASGFVAEERPRVEGVRSTLFTLQVVWSVLIAAGLGTGVYGMVEDDDFWIGVGAGVVAESAAFMIMDTLARRRATIYLDGLRAFEGAASKPAPMMLQFAMPLP